MCVCVCECVCVCVIYMYTYTYIYIYSIRKFIHTALRVSNSLSSRPWRTNVSCWGKIKRQVNVDCQASKWPGQRRAKRKQSTRRRAETPRPSQFYSRYYGLHLTLIYFVCFPNYFYPAGCIALMLSIHCIRLWFCLKARSESLNNPSLHRVHR